MKDVIKYDMFGKVKSVKEIASTALGKVDLGAKVLSKPAKPVKQEPELETPVSEASEGKPEIKGKLLKKLVTKKQDAKETKSGEPNVITEAEQEVKNIPADTTKAMKAKSIAKAKKQDASETDVE